MENIITGHDGQLQGLRVFVVEDHADTLVTFSCYLESLGHTATLAASMTEARILWPMAKYDLLISDLRFPDGEGWDLLQSLPSPRPLYAVAISGFGAAADRARSLAAGYRHHLLKPLVLKDLDVVLREAAQEAAHDLSMEEIPPS